MPHDANALPAASLHTAASARWRSLIHSPLALPLADRKSVV